MLILTRKYLESILLYPSDDLDLSLTVAELFKNQHIEIQIFRSRGPQVKVGITAPMELTVVRRELSNDIQIKEVVI